MAAGERPQPAIEPALEALRPVLGGEIGGEIADQAGEIAVRDQPPAPRGRRTAPGPKAFDDKAERGELAAMRLDQRGRVRVEIDDERRRAAPAARRLGRRAARFSCS